MKEIIKQQKQTADYIESISKRHVTFSCIISIIVTILYFYGFICNIKMTLPHVMVFSTLLLTMVSICFSLMPVMQNRKYTKEMIEHWLTIKEKYYQDIQNSVLLCVGVVITSLCILVIKVEPYIIFKIIMTPLGLFLFANMLITCVSSFTITFLYFKSEIYIQS